MYLRSQLLALCLTGYDVDDLEKDETLKDTERVRDLIMGLYLRAKYSEKMLENSNKEVERLSFELNYSIFVGILFGVLLTALTFPKIFNEVKLPW